jgi:hypothetical protein
MSNNQYFTDDNQYREFLDKIEVLNHDEEFEKIIDIIIEIPENDRPYELNVLLSGAYFSLDRYDEAIELLESIEPDDNEEEIAKYYFYLGMSYYHSGNYDEAIPCFEKTHEIDPKDIDTLLFLCFATSEYGNDELFSEYSQKLEALDKELYDSYFNSQNTVAEAYSDEEVISLEMFIEDNIGEYNNVLRDISTTDISCDLLLIPPNDEHEFYTLVTCGMGAHKMTVPSDEFYDRAELVLCLPKSWHVKSSNEKWFWPLRLMKSLAHLPILENSWIGWGHTISNGEPYFDNTELSGVILGNSPLMEDNVLELPNGEKVCFYQIYLLYEEEMNYKIDTSADDLFNLVGELNPVLDISRKNFCENGRKKYKIPKSIMEDLFETKDSHTGCFATDRIIVDGAEIRFMYREMPLDNQDSGWRFMAGDEDDEYMNDTSKSGIYHLNTLCNYEPSILKFLDEPYGSMFIRNKNGEFVKFER